MLQAFFYNDSTLVKEQYVDKNYVTLKKLLIDFLIELTKGDRQAIYFSQSSIIPFLKTKELARTFLDMLTIAFQDLTNKQIGKDIILESYDTIISQLTKSLHHIDVSLVKIMSTRTQLELNLNIPLLIDKLMIEITEA